MNFSQDGSPEDCRQIDEDLSKEAADIIQSLHHPEQLIEEPPIPVLKLQLYSHQIDALPSPKQLRDKLNNLYSEYIHVKNISGTFEAVHQE